MNHKIWNLFPPLIFSGEIMGLYNVLHGVNASSEELLSMLDLGTKYPIGRFRDIWVSEDGEKIILFTRNGGGNRECYANERCGTNDPDCFYDSPIYCPVIANRELKKHPNYLKDYDDDYDCTYAYFEFSVPDSFKERVKEIARQQGRPKTLKEKSDEVIEEMQTMPKEKFEKDPRFKPLVDVLKKVLKE